MKTKIIPFDLETAKKIQAGEIKGRIKTNNNSTARIVCWNRKNTDNYQLVGLVLCNDGAESVTFYNEKGECFTDEQYNIFLEVPDNEPQFKPFDKVLVRGDEDDFWHPDFFAMWHGEFAECVGYNGAKYIIPYEGNEHLVGTTDAPKED